MRRPASLIAMLIAAGLVLAAAWFALSWRGDGPLARAASVTVPDGASLRGMAARLESAGAIRSAMVFRVGARLFGGDRPIKAGDYRIPAHASAARVLAILQSGRTVPLLVTIPEGMPSIMVRERLLANAALTGPVAMPEEGSVLPDSYGYERGEARAAVLARMQGAMTAYLGQAWPRRDPAIAVRTPREAIALASIVEKETALAAERPVVAGVYYNRLRIGMRLQADPTIIYPITRGKPLGRRILRSEKEARNDYNTYSMAGLPRGPIANPGRSAIDAVLRPAETSALYFVADGKGGHLFARTLAEQEANKARWFAIRRDRGEM